MTQIQKDMIEATLVGIEPVSIPAEVVTEYLKTSEVSIDGENPVKVHEFGFDGTEDFYGAEWYTPAYTDAWSTDPACMRLYVVASDGTRLDFFKCKRWKK